MNVLFVGPYRQQDGWGLATQSYIRAVASQKHNLTTRPVFLGAPSNIIADDILAYENSLYDSYDVVIQKTLPHGLFYNKKFKKNIGLFVLETNNISNSSCIFNINQMDEVWVPSKQEQKCLVKSGVTKPIKVISQPLDTDFIKANKNHTLDLHSLVKKTFKFYFIGEYVERKNIRALVAAFHLAFDISQPVSLIIKTNISNMSPADSQRAIEKDIEAVKKQLNINQKYKQEIIITDRLSDKDIVGLHNSCDCFIMPSFGEAFCRPAAEALVLGKTPIVTDNTGMIDYVNHDNGFVVQSHRTPVLLNQRTLSEEYDIYNANEYWYRINMYDLIEKMRSVYLMNKNEKKKLEEKRLLGINNIDQFSYQHIGDNLCI